jgi:hypothetical protein
MEDESFSTTVQFFYNDSSSTMAAEEQFVMLCHDLSSYVDTRVSREL